MSCLASWYPVDSLSSLLHTDRFLGDARFDLQINNIPRGSEDTVYGNVQDIDKTLSCSIDVC